MSADLDLLVGGTVALLLIILACFINERWNTNKGEKN